MEATIFYLDDDIDDLDFFKYAAKDLGETVDVFLKYDDLIAKLHNPPPYPRVVFVDLNMPFKSGYEVIDSIRNIPHFSNIPLVVFSTGMNESIVNKCISLGANLYIKKPVGSKDLTKIIKHISNFDWSTFTTDNSNFIFNPY